MAEWLSEISFQKCLERLEWEEHRLSSRDHEWTAAKPQARVRQDKSSRAERAFTFIFVAGALEDLFRNLNVDLAEDLHNVQVPRWDLRLASISMLVPNAWDAINGDRVVRLIKRRELVETFNNFYLATDPLDFADISQLGVSDGRTVNVHHFEALWEGLCLSETAASVWLSTQHRQAIVSLGEKRNAIAHFQADPRVEAFRFSYRDLRVLVSRVRETVERVQEHTIVWLDKYG